MFGKLDKPAPDKKPLGFLGYTWPRFRETAVTAASSPAGYRELVVASWGRIFGYLAILVLAAAALLTARDLFETYRYLARIGARFDAGIPAVTVKEGVVGCESSPFSFRSDNPYTAGTYRARLKSLAEFYERQMGRLDALDPDAAERPSPEDEEKFRARARGLAAAAEWAASAFPEPETELKWETLSPRLDEAAAAGELSADAAWGARAAADDGLVFRVDLEDDEPGFDSPFLEGVVVGRDRILLWIPFLPEPLDLAAMAGEKGELVVDVRAWGETVKLILMHVGPMFALLHLVQYLIARLLQVLLGCAVVYAVASIYKIGRIEFRKAFAAAVFALTVPVVLGVAAALLPAPVPVMWLIFLGTYLVYCGLAARHLGELRR